MAQPKQRSDSELLREGCRSYRKALLAVRQFRLEAQETIRAAVDERIDDIAAAMKLDKAEFGEGLTAYADPTNIGQGWDGSEASIGLRYPAKQRRWGITLYLFIGDADESYANAQFWLKEPGLAIRELASHGMETGDNNAWVGELIGDPDGLTGAIGRVLDAWIEIWRKAGGIQQFLPPQRAPENQAGI
jgi:hypothetical protein